MFETNEKTLKEHVEAMQSEMLECMEHQRKYNKPVDFLAGFAHGLQTASMFSTESTIDGILDKEHHVVTVLISLLKLSKEIHEVGHAMNGEAHCCQAIEKKLIQFMSEMEKRMREKNG